MSILYVVGTPIGNLKDISLRAIEVLSSVNFIVCEDTKHTIVLLKAYDISKPLISYHKFSEKQKSQSIIDRIKQGETCAIVTDAGMPTISDPGNILVRLAIEQEVKVESVPGPCAATSAFSVSGLGFNGFVFLGFLPTKTKERTSLLAGFEKSTLPLIIYVAPHDVEATLKYLYNFFGDRKISVVKELTKIYETLYEGTLSSINIENNRGEFVFIVHPGEMDELSDNKIKEALVEYIGSGSTKKDAINKLAKEHNISKNRIYQLSLDI